MQYRVRSTTRRNFSSWCQSLSLKKKLAIGFGKKRSKKQTDKLGGKGVGRGMNVKCQMITGVRKIKKEHQQGCGNVNWEDLRAFGDVQRQIIARHQTKTEMGNGNHVRSCQYTSSHIQHLKS